MMVTKYYDKADNEYEVSITREWRNGIVWVLRVDGDFYSTHEHRSGAEDELVDIIKTLGLKVYTRT